jgi:hypothetical protein
MKMDHPTTVKETEFIVDKLLHDFVNEEGLVSSSYPPTGAVLLKDFNDFIPFLAFYGYEDFIDEQFQKGIPKCVNGLVPVGKRILSWRQDEWLEAVFERYRINQSPELAAVLESGLEFIAEHLVDADFIKSFYNLGSGRSPSVFDPRTGALLEVLLDMGGSFPRAMDMALRCLDRIIEWSDQRAQCLIPDFIVYKSQIYDKISRKSPIPMPRRILYPYVHGWRTMVGDWMITLPFQRRIKLAKQNSNLIHAFFRAYMVTKDPTYFQFVEKWFESFQEYMYEDGRCYSFLDHRMRGDKIKLSHNHPVLEICLDVYMDTGQEQYLQTAVSIADYWIARRLSNGLYPAFDNASYAFLDDQTDLLVLFVRLWKILENPRYWDEAVQLYQAMVHNHMTQSGLATYAYLDKTQNSDKRRIEPKYNALFLKASIAMENHDRILDEDFWLLLRDR